MFNFFKKRIQEPLQEKKIEYPMVNADFFNKKKEVKFGEPETIAKIRLNQKAKDYGSDYGIKAYNAHKVKLQNQWVNASQSVNSGFGNSQESFYNYEIVNYWETAVLSQDPLMNKVLNILSESPLSKGGQIALNQHEDKIDELNKYVSSKKLFKLMKDIIKTSFRDGGCLVLMDFGLKDLLQPLDLKTINPENFVRFKKIDPLYCQAVDVNTVNPTAPDFMKPKKWYIVGLGTCDSSHFLHFEQNSAPDILKPMCLYYGFPLTSLIKSHVANTTLVSQGIANLINRFRYLFLKTSNSNFTTDNAGNFKTRLELMNSVQDNYNYAPLKEDEEVTQLIIPLTNLKENWEFFYQVVASLTSIPMTELMGKSAQGMNATGEGDRRSWHDKQISIQESIKENLIIMLNVLSNKFFKQNINCVDDYTFNHLEELSEVEESTALKEKTGVMENLSKFGYSQESIDKWLKLNKRFNLSSLELDTETEGLLDYEEGIDTKESKVDKSEE